MSTSKLKPPSPKVKRLTVYLDPALDSEIRKLSKIEDRPLSTVAERAFRAYLSMAQHHISTS